MHGLKNFRVLENIKTSDGRRIKPGFLFRSGHLGDIGENITVLREVYGIEKVYDLRTEVELDGNPDAKHEKIGYVHTPSLTDKQNPAVTKETRNRVLTEIMHKEGGSMKHLCDTYRTLVTSEKALDSHRLFLRDIISNPEGAKLWHCTQGKDRTGMCTAVLLMALGVDRKDITRDYMLYNREVAFINTLIFIGVFITSFSMKKAKTLDGLLSARKEYIQAAYDEIDKVYGGTEGFLRNGLKLSEDELTSLKNICLA